MRKNVRFIFTFPQSIFGVYDTGNGIVYIFGNHAEESVEEVIDHEVLHWAVQKIAGEKASLELDDIPKHLLVV